jgi:hypothetical protein
MNHYYLNPGQRYIYELMPRQLTLIAGRRFGKTDGVAAPYIKRVVTNMPRGKSAIYCATLKQGLTRTIPGTVAAIERMTGWSHGIHFFVGCHAPKATGFPEPLTRPYNWEHCIHWFNGHVTHVLSQDVKFSANSLTLDAALVDEARAIRKQKIDEELLPAISGTPGMFLDFPLKKSFYMMTDRPLLRAEQWVCDREASSSPEAELELLHAIELYAALVNEGYPLWAQQKQLEEINALRTACHLFKEYDTLTNIEIVGADYIADMKRILPERIFNISILNIRQKRQADGFYSAYDPERHTYVVESADVVDNMRMEIKPTPKNRIRSTFQTWDFKRLQEHSCFLDLDLDPKQSLNIAFDYNANINWVITGQKKEHNGVPALMVLGSMFVKEPKDIRDLCADWAAYYEPHRSRCNAVNYYYNQTAKQKKYANGGIDEKFHETVRRELVSHGWRVNCVDMGETMLQNRKYFMFVDAFKNAVDPLRLRPIYLFPMFNRENNEFLLAAIENTGRKNGRLGIEKDKGEEKLADSEENPSELRTDGTDAFDDLFMGVNSFHRDNAPMIPKIRFI